MQIQSGASSHPNRHSLFSYYSKLMQILSRTLSPQYIFLIQSSFKIDVEPLWSFLPPFFVLNIPYPVPIINWCKSFLEPPSTLIHIPHWILFQNWCKSSLQPSSAPIHIPYSVLIQNWCKSFLGQFFYPNAYSLFSCYSKLMQILSGPYVRICKYVRMHVDLVVYYQFSTRSIIIISVPTSTNVQINEYYQNYYFCVWV